MARPSVLIADDDAALAENLAEILAALDVDTTIVGNAREALTRAAAGPLDLALVDVRLPDGDGTDLMPRIQSASPLSEVVLITGDATLETAIAAVRGGAFAYVLKPFSPVDLLDTCRRALAQVSLQRERESLRTELERSERRHREVVEAVPAFVLALDNEGRIALWNRHLETVTGFERTAMLGQPGWSLVRGEGPRPLPVKGGGERWVRWQHARVDTPEPERRWTYAVGTDVTAEQEMLRRTLRAERLAAVGTLAAGLAHEVRNPLNSASLQISVLRRRIERLERGAEPLVPVVDLVQDEIRRLEHMVTDFLDFARPRPLELRPTALGELLGGVLEFMRPEAEAAGVRIRTELGAALPQLTADPERLRQVLLNLVKNAIEAMSAGGAAGDLVVRARREGAHIEIEVEDTGPGFADEAPVFDAFFTTKSRGTGLGLSIVHRIVTDHGGTIRVRSRPGSTCFTFSLPAPDAGR